MLHAEKLDEIDATGYGIPVFIATENQERVPAEYLPVFRVSLRIANRDENFMVAS
ncbi:Ornithine decarboxylase [Escherichia coli]|uniref:Ornithine decarboxylase n=1 Tax=Escherichia coli TaxID=562 RepID=A0A377B221_ECOLX|nr:Ornithine decarboxylase [Escherichia coli]